MADYMTLSQRESESPVEFMDRIPMTTRRAKPYLDSAQLEEAFVDRYVQGTCDYGVREWALSKMRDGTLNSSRVVEKAAHLRASAALKYRLREASPDRSRDERRSRERSRVTSAVVQPPYPVSSGAMAPEVRMDSPVSVREKSQERRRISPDRCIRCNQKGHRRAQCPCPAPPGEVRPDFSRDSSRDFSRGRSQSRTRGPFPRREGELRCFRCRGTGHTAARCRATNEEVESVWSRTPSVSTGRSDIPATIPHSQSSANPLVSFSGAQASRFSMVSDPLEVDQTDSKDLNYLSVRVSSPNGPYSQ